MDTKSHFDILAADAARAMAFYTSLFGWRFARMEASRDYWLIQMPAGPDRLTTIGGLAQRNGIFPGRPELKGFVNSFICSFPVADIDSALRRVTELGGLVTRPKFGIPGFGWRADVRDTEMNVFGIIQREARN